MVFKKSSSNIKFGIIKTFLIILACPVSSAIYYQQRQHRFPQIMRLPPPLPRQVRQSPYTYLNAQRYVAVPGRIVQSYNAASVPYTTAPGVQTLPLVSPYLQSFYELESDPSSSNPDHNNNGEEEEQSNGGGLEPPPPESEPEEPPPMMSTMPPPPPPPENDNNDNNNNNDNEDNTDDNEDSPPPPPPPSHHAKIIHKHISIHAPPDELESDSDEVTVIRPKTPGPEKHLNIIFIKAPAMKPRNKKTEVILPETPEQKTLVYVLVKKQDPANDGSIRVRGPAPTKPPKPQVYFIRYKQRKDESKAYVYTEKKRNSHHHHHH